MMFQEQKPYMLSLSAYKEALDLIKRGGKWMDGRDVGDEEKGHKCNPRSQIYSIWWDGESRQEGREELLH